MRAPASSLNPRSALPIPSLADLSCESTHPRLSDLPVEDPLVVGDDARVAFDKQRIATLWQDVLCQQNGDLVRLRLDPQVYDAVCLIGVRQADILELLEVPRGESQLRSGSPPRREIGRRSCRGLGTIAEKKLF